jgi:hypothetical protein
VSQLTRDSFAYSPHIGIFQMWRRLGSNEATIEIKKESQIGDESRSGLSGRFLARKCSVEVYKS